MNNEQLEELEALGYIFTETEMQRDNRVFEFTLSEGESLKIQIIWPESYPECALLFSIIDYRVRSSLRKTIESEVNAFAESLTGSAGTFTVVDYVKENLPRWNLPEEFNIEAQDYTEESVSEAKKTQLTKSQKRKMYKNLDANGEKLRGWDWIDIISHLSKT
ncbi:hypothetical protein SteCoe_25409 [Stentor coeruleus]|uniref:RWD domain-containing protein n=1 Tax=Stentor coeruleus TaxID=5963 RepID=A0A1R2BF89_9CILI|nr:hypothetical protein SteCoe_25409 [Stentor coeruleus]